MLVIYLKQREFIYHISKVEKYQELEQNYTIDGVLIKSLCIDRNSSRAIIYFGGNGESVDYNIPIFSQILKGFDICFVKYRGYGGSQGEPTEENLYRDALYIFDDMKKRYSDISVIGRSLGSGVATYLASKRDIDRVVLVTPFDSLESVAKDAFPIFPISYMLKDKFNSIDRVGSIKCKTLVITAQNDKLITKEHSSHLIDRFQTDNIESLTIKKADHNSISFFQEYTQAIDDFFMD